MQEYYTVVRENSGYKLNINNYVGRENLNIKQDFDNVELTVASRDVFMDYVLYNFRIKNNNNFDIVLDGKQNPKSTYLSDRNKVQYVAFINELVPEKLKIIKGFDVELSIKFNKTYMPDLPENKLVFSDIILNDGNIKNIEIKL